MRNKLSLLLIVVMVSVLALSACTPKPPVVVDPGAPTKDTLVIGQYGDPPNLDPHNALNDNAMRVMLNVYDPLVRTDKDFNVLPCVAERWEISDDGLEYTFYIKQGIKFHNGDELKPSDVVFSITRGIASPQASPSYAGVVSAELVGDNAVKVTLSTLNNQLLTAFALPLAGILNESVVTGVEAGGGKYGREPIGSGPYKLVNWVTGEKIELAAFEDYHEGPASISQVTFRAIGDHSAALIGLQKGEVDVYIDLAQSNFDDVRDSSTLELYLGRSFNYMGFGLKCTQPPFDNVLVRRAIAHAVDKDTLINGVNEGVGEIIDTVATSDMLGYTDNIVRYEYSLEKAKDLLIEAGYPDGFECNIVVYTDIFSKFSQVFQNSLEQIGIKANVLTVERAAYDDMVRSGQAHIFNQGNTYSGLDLSDNSFYRSFHSDFVEAGTNRSGYKNAELDRLIDLGRASRDAQERAEYFSQALVIISEEVPTIPFIWSHYNVVANKDLKGVYVHPQAVYNVYEWTWSK